MYTDLSYCVMPGFTLWFLKVSDDEELNEEENADEKKNSGKKGAKALVEDGDEDEEEEKPKKNVSGKKKVALAEESDEEPKSKSAAALKGKSMGKLPSQVSKGESELAGKKSHVTREENFYFLFIISQSPTAFS